jgi:hypothetical protein
MKIRSLFPGMLSSVTETRNQYQYFDTLQIVLGPLADIRYRASEPGSGFGLAGRLMLFEGLAKTEVVRLADLKTPLVDLQGLYPGFERGYGDSKLSCCASLARDLPSTARQLSFNDVPFLVDQLIRQ